MRHYPKNIQHKNSDVKNHTSSRVILRHRGIIVSLQMINDYSPCEHGGEPRWFVRLLTHKRRQRSRARTNRWYSDVLLPSLIPGQWVEIIMTYPLETEGGVK